MFEQITWIEHGIREWEERGYFLFSTYPLNTLASRILSHGGSNVHQADSIGRLAGLDPVSGASAVKRFLMECSIAEINILTKAFDAITLLWLVINLGNR